MCMDDFIVGGLVALGCYLFGKNEDKIVDFAKKKILEFKQAKDPEEKKKILEELRKDPTMQELIRQLQAEK